MRPTTLRDCMKIKLGNGNKAEASFQAGRWWLLSGDPVWSGNTAPTLKGWDFSWELFPGSEESATIIRIRDAQAVLVVVEPQEANA